LFIVELLAVFALRTGVLPATVLAAATAPFVPALAVFELTLLTLLALASPALTAAT